MPAPPPRRWGWHRLDAQAARRLVAEAGIGPGDLVLDIGAGTGAITAPLVDAGARVVAIELHRQRIGILRARFADDPVRVVRADAADLRLPRRPFRVVANPPFAVTMALVRRLVHRRSRLIQADLVVPRHVARRWVSTPTPGFVSSVAGRISRDAFEPPVRRDAAHLRIEAHQPG